MVRKTWEHGPSGSEVIPDCLGMPILAKSSIQRISEDPDELEGLFLLLGYLVETNLIGNLSARWRL